MVNSRFMLPNIPFDPRKIESDKAIKEAYQSLSSNNFVKGNLITGIPDSDGNLSNGIVFTASTDLVIYHKLKRRWQGFFAVSFNGGSGYAVLAPSTTQPDDPTSTLSVVSQNNCVCYLYVF